MAGTTIFLCLVFLLCIHVARNVYKPGLIRIPGPFWAKFTDLWRMNEVHQSRYASMLRRVHKRYGSVVRLGPNLVSISDPAVIEKIYGLKTNFVKSAHVLPLIGLRAGAEIPNLLASRDQATHARLKRPISSAYSMSTISKFEPFVDDIIRKFVQRLDEEFVEKGEKVEGRRCDIDNWVQYFAYDVICELTMSRTMGFLDQGKDVGGVFKDLDGIFNYQAYVWQNPLLDYVFRRNPIAARFPDHGVPFIERAREILKERVNSPVTEESDRRDFVSRFLEAQKAYPDVVDDVTLVSYVVTNLMAGSDTLAVALRSIIYYVLKNPKVHEKLQIEMDNYQGDHPISFKESQTLPYLGATISEALRVHGVSSLLNERVVPAQGLELPDGRKLPAGTIVGTNVFSLWFNTDLYGSDAEEFNPDRWLQDSEESAEHFKARLDKMRSADLSFSTGTRTCIGRNIAKLELFKATATLFGLFDMALADPKKEWHVDERFFARQSDMDIIIKRRQGKTHWSTT